MDSENLIRQLIQTETNNDRKFILFMLLKFYELVTVVKEKDEFLPLIMLQKDHIMMLYKNEEFDDMEYIFTDHEEILHILQKCFYENKRIYFYCDLFEERVSKNELMKKIEEAIKNNDKEQFAFYAKKYNELG